MATIHGTVKGISLATGSPAGVAHAVSTTTYTRKSYLCSVDFGAYDASADTADIAGLGAAISAFIRDGKTRTLRADAPPTCVGGAKDDTGQVCFIGVCTVSVDTAAFSISDGAGTEVGDFTAVSGIQLLVPVDETPA